MRRLLFLLLAFGIAWAAPEGPDATVARYRAVLCKATQGAQILPFFTKDQGATVARNMKTAPGENFHKTLADLQNRECELKLGTAKVHGEKADVEAQGLSHDKKMKLLVTYRLVKVGGKWLIDAVDSDSEDLTP